MSFLIPSAFAQSPITSIAEHKCVVDGIPTLQCFEVIFENILKLASGLVVLVLFLMFVAGAFTYLTSAGDAEKVAKARSTFMWAVLGTVLFLGSFLILKVIELLFIDTEGGFSLFKFEIPGGTPKP